MVTILNFIVCIFCHNKKWRTIREGVLGKCSLKKDVNKFPEVLAYLFEGYQGLIFQRAVGEEETVTARGLRQCCFLTLGGLRNVSFFL